MKKRIGLTLAVLGGLFLLLAHPAASQMGGVFDPLRNYLVKGQWTWNGASPIIFEGATDDGFETTLTITDPTADRTITLPDATDTLMGRATTDTLTNKTLTSPTITAPSGSASTGMMITKSARFVEDGATTTYTATIPIPAGAVVHEIMLIAEALWDDGTAASAIVGDTADDNGYFTAVDLKATDLLVNEVLSIKNDAMWGGTEGAYLVAATGQRGPTTTNFGLYYAAGSNITCIITTTDQDGSAGRTVFSVTYSVGEVITVTLV